MTLRPNSFFSDRSHQARTARMIASDPRADHGFKRLVRDLNGESGKSPGHQALTTMNNRTFPNENKN